MSIREKVLSLLESEGEDAEVVKDVLRVLAVFHGVLWESELLQDILKVREYQVPYVPTPDKLRKAVDKLEKEGIVIVEERTRGLALSPSTYKDRLIRLVKPLEVKAALYQDPIYARAVATRAYALKKALKGK